LDRVQILVKQFFKCPEVGPPTPGRKCRSQLADGFASDLTQREVAAHCVRMRNAANRNYLASLKALALIRKAAPAVMINVNTTVRTGKRREGRPITERFGQSCRN
jgi:hypothetical protein